MKTKILMCSALMAFSLTSSADLYYVADESLESLPIKWTVGGNLIFDDNVAPGVGPKESSMAINPYVGATWINVTPQTSIDVFARLGLIHYFDAPNQLDDVNSQSRLGVNVTHRFSERLRVVSRNFIAHELEPDYAQGYANTRQAGEYFYWQTNNSVGFRWTERFATYTGFSFSGVDYENSNDNDRTTWGLHNQFRYQLTPQTVLTADYRYNDTSASGLGRDSQDHFALLGVEHRFSPNTVGVLRAGFQHRDVEGGSNATEPSVEFALNSRVNDQLTVRAFTRYSMESYDTVRVAKVSGQTVQYDERRTLRVGVGAEYMISPRLALNTGIDYIPASYRSGVRVDGGGGVDNFPASADDDVISAMIGFSYQLTDILFGTVHYTYSDSSSDLAGRDYNRNRVSLGMRAEF